MIGALVHYEAVEEYSELDQSEPNCVIVGDAAEYFNYENMNKAFRILMNSKNPIILALGSG